MIDAAVAGKLFNEFLPCPEELREEVETGDNYVERRDALIARNQEKYGYPSWYEWSIDNWGTKWDTEIEEDSYSLSEDGKTVSMSFDTAWGPPCEWYDNIDGFSVVAYYYEPGMGFCGKWTTMDGDDQHEITMDEDIDELQARVPADILDAFGIVDEVQYYQDEQESEELTDDEEINEEGEDK